MGTPCSIVLFSITLGIEYGDSRLLNENKRLPPSEIEEACRSKHKTIEKAITGTMKKYKVGKGILARATTTFMEDVSLKPVRDRLGILP